jgi:hypothetical protein
MVEHK